MKNKIIGLVILLGVIVFGAVAFFMSNAKPNITVKGFVGGEKIGFLEDAEVKKILKDKYGITIDYSKAGSIEMVKEETGDADFLFPSSQTAVEIFKSEKGQKLVKSETVFNSPIVIYSWDSVTEALIKQGIVKKIDETYYIVDSKKLIDLVIEQKSWADIGLNELFGKIMIVSTDPTKSNSGNQFSGLLANLLNNGEVVNETTLLNVLDEVQNFYSRIGYLEHSSSDLFESYLRTGVGAKPIIVGYENQIIEFATDYPNDWKNVKENIRILYPEPTVWSDHTVIALNEKGKELITALQDPDIKKIAWEKHGFRTGIQNDPKVLSVSGVPQAIKKIVPMPNPVVMDKIIKALQ